MERAEAHLPSYGFFCWCCVHLGYKISLDVSCADDMTGKQAGIELCAVPFFRQAFQVYDTFNSHKHAHTPERRLIPDSNCVALWARLVPLESCEEWELGGAVHAQHMLRNSQ